MIAPRCSAPRCDAPAKIPSIWVALAQQALSTKGVDGRLAAETLAREVLAASEEATR